MKFYMLVRLALNIHRLLRDRCNPFEEYDDSEFRDRFCFNKESVMSLLEIIKSDLEFSSKRNNYISPILQLTTTLRFFAIGNFQRTDRDLMGFDQSTIYRIVHRVARSIAKRKCDFISFLSNSHLTETKQKFYGIVGFPGVLGCIDGTHVPIISPGGDQAELYRNRKGFFSINVQAVCDADSCFTNIVCRWPGSTHDGRIFNNSSLCYKFESGEINGIFLGDSGYACRKYMMTPLLNPVTSKEKNCNCAHIATCSEVERMFKVWKQRFRCLRIPLRTKLSNILITIVATACLHNYAAHRRKFYAADLDDDSSFFQSVNDNGQSHTIAGNALRQQIIEQYL